MIPDQEKRYRESLIKSEAGQRLSKDPDFQIYIEELDKDFAENMIKLRETPTTDPIIAEIQGKLTQIQKNVSIIRTWMKISLDISKEIHHNIIESNQEGDYENG